VLFTYNAGWLPLFVNWGYYARYKENSNSRAIYCDQSFSPGRPALRPAGLGEKDQARAPVPESRYIGQPGHERNYFEGVFAPGKAGIPALPWGKKIGYTLGLNRS
jgi:hypothetical protein